MDDIKKLEDMRDTFRKSADIIDELLSLKERENNGEDVERECESIIGRFMVTMMRLQTIQAEL